MKIDKLAAQIDKFLTKQNVFGILAAIGILFIGFFLARRLSTAIARVSRLDTQQKLLLQKASYYLFATGVIAAALSQLGFDLKVLLGAAGVLTVAVGFAAQTSASNLISGLFLIVDKPFVVGDMIEIGGNKGEVLSIDLLSVKIRTFDNLLVRVPNETMVKSDIKNFSFFPIRRIDLKFGVGYKEDIARVRDVLYETASRNPLVLDEPPPMFIFEGFGDSSMNIQFSVWSLKDNLLMTQNSILQEIKAAFDINEIELPYPYRSLVFPEPAAARPPTALAPDHLARARLQRSWVYKNTDGV